MIKIWIICMQRVKDGQCCGYNFTSTKPRQLYEVIHGCKMSREAGDRSCLQLITLAAESSSQSISPSQPQPGT